MNYRIEISRAGKLITTCEVSGKAHKAYMMALMFGQYEIVHDNPVIHGEIRHAYSRLNRALEQWLTTSLRNSHFVHELYEPGDFLQIKVLP